MGKTARTGRDEEDRGVEGMLHSWFGTAQLWSTQKLSQRVTVDVRLRLSLQMTPVSQSLLRCCNRLSQNESDMKDRNVFLTTSGVLQSCSNLGTTKQ